MGGGLDGLKTTGADPGHGRKFVSAAVTAFLPHPAQNEIGEGFGHELGAEALLVVDQDDLSEVSGGAGVRSTANVSPPLLPKPIQPGEPARPCTAASGAVLTARVAP